MNNKNQLPDWTRDEGVKMAKWIGPDDILALLEGKEGLSLKLCDTDLVLIEDIAGMVADQISDNELMDAYKDIESVDDFYEEKKDLVMKGRLRLEPIL